MAIIFYYEDMTKRLRNIVFSNAGLRLNIGCGRSPVEWWLNFDNSWSLRLSIFPFLGRIQARSATRDND